MALKGIKNMTYLACVLITLIMRGAIVESKEFSEGGQGTSDNSQTAFDI